MTTDLKLIPGITTEHYSYDAVDLIAAGRKESFSVPVRVTGYWSNDPIVVYVRRQYHDNDWTVELTHSSGGRDTEVEQDDLLAECNFGAALIAASVLGSMIRSATPTLEAGYQEALAERKHEQELKKQTMEIRRREDAPLGEDGAAALIAEARARLAAGAWHVRLAMVVRGTDTVMSIWAVRGADDKVRFGAGCYEYSSNRVKLSAPINEASLVADLASCSHTSHIAEE